MGLYVFLSEILKNAFLTLMKFIYFPFAPNLLQIGLGCFSVNHF